MRAIQDDDDDGFPDDVDTCPTLPDPDQLDLDVDLVGDACDEDDDGDGFLDVDEDTCPRVYNDDQVDTDNDGFGDACDDDDDDDGLLDGEDNCPQKENPDQADADGDFVGDLCDGDEDADGLDAERRQLPLRPQSRPGGLRLRRASATRAIRTTTATASPTTLDLCPTVGRRRQPRRRRRRAGRAL
jgi:hypothetical protein